MSFTREQWARSFLCSVGNCNPTQNTLNWTINWTAAEDNSTNVASFNLLNTTQPMPGSHGGGSQGNIQFFTSFDQGIQANSMTLQNGLYPDLLNALKTNNESALGFGGSPSSGVMANLNTWCGACGYGNWFASQSPSSTLLSQQYSGQGPTNNPSPVVPVSSGGNILGLPDAQSIAKWFQQFALIVFGMLIVLIGVGVVFFSEGGKIQSKVQDSV